MTSVIFEAINVTKRFGALTALDQVSLRLKKGHVHALLGENGAGKSTLVKCIMGYYSPDDGDFLLDDRQVKIDNTNAAHALGIGMVYQHFTLVPNMSVAENLILARPNLPSVIDWKREIKLIERKLAHLPFTVSLQASVNDLSAGERQKVEILKQLLLDTRILILDEPTSVLTPNEADEVLTTIKALTRSRHLSVLMITHKFREVTGFADEVTVLRRGKFVGHAQVRDVTPQQLAGMMIGKEAATRSLHRTNTSSAKVVLELEKISALGDRGVNAVNDFSVRVAAGEIVGIAGVSGNGQRELLEIVAGQRPLLAGAITINGHAYQPTRRDMQRYGVHCLPEEPLRNACTPTMSVAENLALRVFDQAGFARARVWLNRKAMKRYAQEKIAQYRIKAASTDHAISTLSGGNVQRCVLARELTDKVNVLVIANPCFGLDFQAVSDIRARIMEARNRGVAVLLISEDLDEILELSDRIVVMAHGSAVYETSPMRADLNVIGQYMAGHA